MSLAQGAVRARGVEQLIQFVPCDFAQTPLPGEPGLVIMNPEYGDRLDEMKTPEPLYTRIHDFVKQRCAGWIGGVFTGNRELSKRIALRANRRVPFMNAHIECRLLEYELYEGLRG